MRSAAYALLATRVLVSVRDVHESPRGKLSAVALAVVAGAVVPLAGGRFADALVRWSLAAARYEAPSAHWGLAGVWLACLVLGAIAFGVEGFASQSARVLASMPIVHAARYRAIMLQAATSRPGVLVAAFLAGVLLRARTAPPPFGADLAVLCLGAAAAFVVGSLLWVGLTTQWVARRDHRRRGRAWLVAHALLVTCAGATLPLPGGPLVAAGLLGVAALAAVGPAARISGEATFAALISSLDASGAPPSVTTPLVGRWLARLRVPTGALLFRGYATRRRSPFTYVRALLLGAAVLAFPLVLPSLTERVPWPRWAIVAVYALAVTHLVVHEVAVQAMAGEGARFALLLRCPLKPLALLRARAAATAVPVLVVATVVTLALGWIAGLRGWEWVPPAAVAFVASPTAAVALALLGSFDLDLARAFDTPMEAMFADEAPVEPIRLALLGVTALLETAQVVALARLPLPAALVLLVASAGLLATAAVALARARLATLVRGVGR